MDPLDRWGLIVSRDERAGRHLGGLWWLATVAVPLGSWLTVAWLDAATRAVDLPPLAEAQFLASPASTPPSDSAGWQRRSLPDDWARSRPGSREGWYRLSFRADGKEAASWAVYLPALSMNAAVYVNGQRIGDGGRLEDPVARNWNRPLIFAFSTRSLVGGENRIYVRLKTDRIDAGLLGPVYVGPEAPVRRAYTRRNFFTVVSLQGIAVAQAVVIVFTATLWLLRRQETYYGWFAVACLVWTVAWLNLLVVDIPMPTRAWDWLSYASGGWFVLLIVWFILDFVGDRRRRVKRLLFGYGFIGSAAIGGLAFFDSPWFHLAATRGWIALAYLTIGYHVYAVQAILRRHPDNIEYQVAHFSVLSLLGCGIHDGLVLVGVLGRVHGFYAPYAAPVLQLGIGWILVHRFVGALGRSEALAADLDRRVDQLRQELERSHERARQAESKRILADERGRIMRDMHDGLGSHLVSTLAMLEHGGVRPEALGEAVRGALDDLRVMVDSIDFTGGDLLPALGMLRSGMRSRLEASGIGVQWRVEDVPAIPGLGPDKVLQVVRITQEAITNVLKHARATTVTVRTGEESSLMGARVYIEIADDGRGMGASPTPGRGVENMRRRATEIGAVFDIRSSSSGTVVRLSVPIVPPQLVG